MVFDLDGTLINSAIDVLLILNEMLEELNEPSVCLTDVLPVMSEGGLALIRKVFGSLVPGQNPSALLSEFRRRYRELQISQHLVYPGVRDCLKVLKERGFQLSVCTNKPRVLAEKVLRELNLDSFFFRLSAGDDLFCSKPSPETLLHATGPISRPDRVFLVGDSVIDQQLADNFGSHFIFFSGGYDNGVDRTRVKFSFENYINFPFAALSC